MTDKKSDKKALPAKIAVTSIGDINIFEPVLKRCTKAGKDVASVAEIHHLQSLLESGRSTQAQKFTLKNNSNRSALI